MRYIAFRTEDGEKKGKLASYCLVLGLSRQGFYQHLTNRERPWKYQTLADAMLEIVAEDACNDTYGRTRMRQTLELKAPEEIAIPSERTVHRVMERLGLSHHPKRKPNGITKEDREAMESNNLLKRDFSAENPLEKCATDITEVEAKDEKLYVPAIFDCFDVTALSLAMETNMRTDLYVRTPENAIAAYPSLEGASSIPTGGDSYQRRLPPGRHPIRHPPEHERCGRSLPRQRPFREYVEQDEERVVL